MTVNADLRITAANRAPVPDIDSNTAGIDVLPWHAGVFATNSDGISARELRATPALSRTLKQLFPPTSPSESS
ncbi:hypothetical protein [Mycobacterium sp. 236(2023)]|uniref:hypothetical protein n=1 Tax=Mycobacterium sp. 236(2023) TaxID=3038163 RepID=UPI0024150FE1|nr:hypothetical protein [Mycobacterium sp. 236(2023)]MDG4669291.1 hypothetical protein [Mycobacterium sp. 236(2023)]